MAVLLNGESFPTGKLNYLAAPFVLAVGATGETGGGAGFPVGAGIMAGRPY